MAQPAIQSFEGERAGDIAIIGLSFKFPQEATSQQAFWQMLLEGRSARSRVPQDRFNIDAHYHPDIGRSESSNVRDGNFLQADLAAFDAQFFSINPAEASAMDPNQRCMLETAYRALENGGISMARAASSKTSVFVGSSNREWGDTLLVDPLDHKEYEATGAEASFLANRLSWFYNLTGPSVTLDTACSSSLLALHLACQSLRTGESDIGLVGGTNLILSPVAMVAMNNMRMLSPDGRSYSFDERANGYGRGEGFGIVVIKPLSHALRDGDTIRAVVRSSGTNQDGRTPSITQPSGSAQEALIRDTYIKAGLQQSLTGYFEAHGTGTQIGDPEEAKAIAAAFEGKIPKGQTLYVGAVKSNIGHLEGASGIPSLIKTILALENGVIPQSIGLENVNNMIPRTDYIKFPTESVLWPNGVVRRASINSFGFGGTNVHVILDDALHYLRNNRLEGNHTTRESLEGSEIVLETPDKAAAQSTLPSKSEDEMAGSEGPSLLLWSAADEAGLKRISSVYADHLSRCMTLPNSWKYLQNLAFTLADRRTPLRWRSYKISASLKDLKQGLDERPLEPFRARNNAQLGLVFTGQGAQWHGMGKELAQLPVFNDSLVESQNILHALGCNWSLKDIMWSKEMSHLVDVPDKSQSICTALQIALVDLLESWGLHSSSTLGHSSGEIAAAYCVGAISKESALLIALRRGELASILSQSSGKQGAMMSVALSDLQAQSFLDEHVVNATNSSVVIGCINSPSNVTLSGDADQIEYLRLKLDHEHVFARKLKVNVAYHSKAMEDVSCEYKRLIRDIRPGRPKPWRPRMISSVTGKAISLKDLAEADYWIKNMVSRVNFTQAFKTLIAKCEAGSGSSAGDFSGNHRVTDLLEVGPHSALQAPIRECLTALSCETQMTYTALLVRHIDACQSSLSAIGRLSSIGHSVDITAINQRDQSFSKPQVLTDLPEYPFNHTKSYWAESRLSKDLKFREHPRHELLGTLIPGIRPLEPTWRHRLRPSDNPWLEDHLVNGIALYPAAGLIAMAVEAACQTVRNREDIIGFKLSNILFEKGLRSLPSSKEFELQLDLRPVQGYDDGALLKDFVISSFENQQWAENCRGTISIKFESQNERVECDRVVKETAEQYKHTYDAGVRDCKTEMSSQELYEQSKESGISYGPRFQVLDGIRVSNIGAKGNIQLRKWAVGLNEHHYQQHIVHPTALDGAFQLCFPSFQRSSDGASPTLVPERVRNLWISAHGLSGTGQDQIKAYAKRDSQSPSAACYSIVALDKNKDLPRIVVDGLELTSVDYSRGVAPPEALPSKRICFSNSWRPDLSLLTDLEIETYCKASAQAPTHIDKVVENIEFLCFSFFRSTLETMASCNLTATKPHLVRYIDWMKRQRERYNNGDMIHWKASWETLRNDHEYVQSVLSDTDRYPGARLFTQTGRNLLSVLEGKVDPLELLFANDQASDTYQDATEQGCKPLIPYIDSMIHRQPGLRFLEIGAGTGSTTEFLLRTLARGGLGGAFEPRYEEYCFSDISPSFFEKARLRFHEHLDRMSFKTLDIGLDPLVQGFEEGYYDVLVAVNVRNFLIRTLQPHTNIVLHATPNILTTLHHARKLLKSGGKLILCELFNDSTIRAEFAFGLLPGWWLSTEKRREWSPLMPAQSWHESLCETGFSGNDMVFRDYDDPRNNLFNVIVTSANNLKADPENFPKPTILISKESMLQQTVADEVQRQMSLADDEDFAIIDLSHESASHVGNASCVILLEIENSFLHPMTTLEFERLRIMICSSTHIVWVTNGGGRSSTDPRADIVLGLARVLRSEMPHLKFCTVALESFENIVRAGRHIVSVIKTSSKSLRAYEGEYLEERGMLHVNRILGAPILDDFLSLRETLPVPKLERLGLNDRALQLRMDTPGLLDSFKFVDDPESHRPIMETEVEVQVKAVGLNFKDVLSALGRLKDGRLGNECAGLVRRAGPCAGFSPGDRVCLASTTVGVFGTYIRVKADLVFRIPDTIPLRVASALPINFSTAYLALYEIGKLSSDESILIHCGAGGTGQATIQLAQIIGADIFVTVGSEDKKKLVMDLYKIPEDHIFSSRSTSFVQGIKWLTKGLGVDVILNSLAGESLHGSWDCLAPFGRFLEIGKNDILKGNRLNMFPFNENRSFIGVNLDHLGVNRPRIMREATQKVLALAERGKIHVPQPLHIYSVSQLEEAFRYLQGGRNTGKVVIDFGGEELVSIMPSVYSANKHSFKKDRTYVVAGGLGGLGKVITTWMVQRGAQHLMLLSRSGARDDETKLFLAELQDKDIDVVAPVCDIGDEQALDEVLGHYCAQMPPFGGCVQATMVLQDSLFSDMSIEAFETPLRSKIDGSWNLHKLLPRGLDFFILLSSTCGIVGFHGQSNYASGNTYQDALARHRVALGEKAISLDLGVVATAGYVSKQPQVLNKLLQMGYPALDEDDLMAALEYYCDPVRDVPSDRDCQVIMGLPTPALLLAEGKDELNWLLRPQFGTLHQMDRVSTSDLAEGKPESLPVSTLLSRADTAEKAVEIIKDAYLQKLSRLLSMPVDDLDPTVPAYTLGVDSLVAVEVVNWFGREVKVNVKSLDILGNQSIEEVCLDAAKKIQT